MAKRRRRPELEEDAAARRLEMTFVRAPLTPEGVLVRVRHRSGEVDLWTLEEVEELMEGFSAMVQQYALAVRRVAGMDRQAGEVVVREVADEDGAVELAAIVPPANPATRPWHDPSLSHPHHERPA